MSSEFYDIANIGNSPPTHPPPSLFSFDYRNLYLSEAKLFLPPSSSSPTIDSSARLYADDRCHAPTDSIHPVFPSYFSTILKGGGQRKTILNLREASRGSGRMIDHPRILTRNRSPKTSSSLIRLMTKPRMKQASVFLSFELENWARQREREREEIDAMSLSIFTASLPRQFVQEGRNRREGAALLARLKPLPSSPVGISVKVEILDPPRTEQLAIILAGVGRGGVGASFRRDL